MSNQVRIIRQLGKDWKSIDRDYLYKILKEFRYDKLVDYEELPDGQTKLVLSTKGRQKIVSFDLDNLKINRTGNWDGRWRLVAYDIPEKKKAAREALRDKLKELGFYEWQKSLWIFPFPCQPEIEFIVEVFDIRSYVRYGEMMNLISDADLRLHFNL